MSAPVIRASALVKKYGDFAAVDGIDFEVAPGESFGLLGPNGAGKSTTMRMVGAVSTRTGGELELSDGWGFVRLGVGAQVFTGLAEVLGEFGDIVLEGGEVD